jgi:hypothetical protein
MATDSLLLYACPPREIGDAASSWIEAIQSVQEDDVRPRCWPTICSDYARMTPAGHTTLYHIPHTTANTSIYTHRYLHVVVGDWSRTRVHMHSGAKADFRHFHSYDLELYIF